MSEKDIPTLIINDVESPEVFNKMKELGLIKEDELYIVDDIPMENDEYLIDPFPQKNSSNLVRSGGVYKAIEEIAQSSMAIEGGADIVVSDSIKETLPEDGRYIIEFTAEDLPMSDFSLRRPSQTQSSLTIEDVEALIQKSINAVIGGEY